MKSLTVFSIAIVVFLTIQSTEASVCKSALELFKAIEYVRRYPNKCADSINTNIYLNGRKAGTRHFGGDGNCISTGYTYSKSMSGLRKNKFSVGLSLGSQYTVAQLYSVGKLDHYVGGKSPAQRCERYTSVSGWGENLAGTPKTDRSATRNCSFWVYLWIVDCGVSTRGHRISLFDKARKFQYMGCYADGRVAAMNMAGRATLKSQYRNGNSGYGIPGSMEGRTVADDQMTNDVVASDFSWL